MPGAAQCGSSPRRRFRDTEPIINQRGADRQPSVPRNMAARWRFREAGPHGRHRVFATGGSANRAVAILPVPARVGLLTNCKGSSDERSGLNLRCRESGIGTQSARKRSIVV
ncbi:hypothetical protein DPV79_34830 [Burkholderia reimsis]|uniref:Uncharacterized protein n=1 Tax=Burkholderia reimsis TaxID=2234132 RepID=A0A365QJX5_9BURK|nr:hypothetical protein DPV79_34830 [Burkholderia reimsis]